MAVKSNVNLENERKYLESVAAQGGGKADWANKQAAKYGITLGGSAPSAGSQNKSAPSSPDTFSSTGNISDPWTSFYKANPTAQAPTSQGVADVSGWGKWVQNFSAPAEPQVPDQNEMLMKFMESMMAPVNEWMNQSKQMAARAAEERKSSFGRLITNLGEHQDADLAQIQSGLASTKQDLEDRGFQDFLEARQMMANRGLAGSGLASDQDTRLLLDRGRQLARANQDALAQGQKVRAGYSGRIADAQAQLAGVSQSDLESQFYQQMAESGNKNMTERAKLFLDMFKEMGGQQFDYTKLATENKQFYDKLTSDEKIAFGKMDNENQQLAAKLAQEYNLKMSEIMGVGPNGQPTLDAMKLAETIRHNQASEFVDAQRIAQSAADNAARLTQDINEFNARIDMQAAQLANTQWATQGANLKSLLTSKGQEISSISSMLKGMEADDPNRAGLQAQLDRSIQQHHSYARALDDLTYGRLPGQGGSTGGGSQTGGLKAIWDATLGKLFKKSSASSGGGSGGAAYNPK